MRAGGDGSGLASLRGETRTVNDCQWGVGTAAGRTPSSARFGGKNALWWSCASARLYNSSPIACRCGPVGRPRQAQADKKPVRRQYHTKGEPGS